MATQAFETFRRVVTVAWPKQQAAQAKALLIRTAKAGHGRIMAAQGAPSFEAYANRPGRPVEQVELPGPIVYRYAQVARIVEAILDELRRNSPVASGAYATGHTVFVNGVAVDQVPRDLKSTDEIYIANLVVYARRIEVGRTKSGRAFVLQVPNRIYERVAKRFAARRFGDQAKVTFGYVTLADAFVTRGGLSSHYGTGRVGRRGGGTLRKRRQRAGSKVQQPAIFIGMLS